MSFKSFFSALVGDVGKVVAIATPIEPFLGMIPGAGPIVTTVFNTIVAVDHLITPTGTPGFGAAKKTAVTQIVNTVHPGLNQAELSTAIDGIVAAINLFQQALTKVPPATQPTGVTS